jgi:hypothetical protein
MYGLPLGFTVQATQDQAVGTIAIVSALMLSGDDRSVAGDWRWLQNHSLLLLLEASRRYGVCQSSRMGDSKTR